MSKPPRRRKKKPYSKSELNKLIDNLLHPLAKNKAKTSILILDECLHILVEQNPTQSLQKFIKHTLPKIVEKHLKTKKT